MHAKKPQTPSNFPRGRIAWDTETTGLDPWKGARIFMMGAEDEAGNVLLAEPRTREWERLSRVLADPKVEKVGWNLKYDLKMAGASNLKVADGLAHDAMLMTYMNHEYEPNLKLKDCARRHLGEPGDEEKEVKTMLAKMRRAGMKDANYSNIPRKLMRRYLEKDLDDTMRMNWKMCHVETGAQRRVYEIERELIPNVVKMENRGIRIDVEYCKKQIASLGPRVQKAKEVMSDLAGVNFNVNSGHQLTEILRGMGLDTGETNKNGTMKLGAHRLRSMSDHPFIVNLKEYRALSKIGTTYFESFLEHQTDGIIHPSFWPFGQDKGIKTGRFSSSDPNFQNIPGGGRGENAEMLKDPGLVRRAIVPRPGHAFVFGDYKQIEFVIFACSVGDPGLLADLRRGVDFHTANAYRLFGRDCMAGKSKEEIKRIRFQAKELNFSFIFGMGVSTYAMRAGLDIAEARARKYRFFSEIPAARDFLMRAQSDLLRDGYVQDQFGRRYHVPRDLAYKAANALCQGPAGLVMKKGINEVFRKLRGMDAHPMLTVHDELVLEVKKDLVYDCAKTLEEGMRDTETFAVPIEVDISATDENWAAKKPWQEVESKWKSLRKPRIRVRTS